MNLEQLEAELNQVKRQVEELKKLPFSDVILQIRKLVHDFSPKTKSLFTTYLADLQDDAEQNTADAQKLLDKLREGGKEDDLLEDLAYQWKKSLRYKWLRYKASNQSNTRMALRRDVDVRDFRGGRPKKKTKDEVEKALES